MLTYMVCPKTARSCCKITGNNASRGKTCISRIKESTTVQAERGSSDVRFRCMICEQIKRTYDARRQLEYTRCTDIVLSTMLTDGATDLHLVFVIIKNIHRAIGGKNRLEFNNDLLAKNAGALTCLA